MAVPTTNISLLGLQRELSDNNYNSSRSYTNISLNSISTGGSSQINRLNPLTKIRSSTRGTGGYKLADFASYDHNFDFVSAAIKFNTGNALFRTDADEARTYGVTANKSYAKQYLASGTPYGELQLIANKNNRKMTVIGNKTEALDITRTLSVTHQRLQYRGQKMKNGNGPDTYDYPSGNKNGYRGSLSESTKLANGFDYQVATVEIDSSGALTDSAAYPTTSYTNNSNSISLLTLFNKNYDYSGWTKGTYVLVFNFGKWTYREGPRNKQHGPAGIVNGVKCSAFQLYNLKID
jgi:hypothetical protein